MNPKTDLTPELRLATYQRYLAGEKQNAIARDLGCSRQAVSEIVARQAAADGNSVPGGRTRDLAKKMPTEFSVLRQLVTSRTPQELGVGDFTKWNDRALQALALSIFQVQVKRPEAKALLHEWGIVIPLGRPPSGHPASRKAAEPRRGYAREALPRAYQEYMDSPAGQRVAAGLKAYLEKEQAARLASGRRGWPPKPLGARYSVNPDPRASVYPETDSMPNRAEIEVRLHAARAILGDSQVQQVIGHYLPRC